MTTILWKTNSQILVDYAKRSECSDYVRGGRAYELLVIKVLSEKYDLRFDERFIKSGTGLIYALRSFFYRRYSDVNIYNPMTLVVDSLSREHKNLCILHHVDFDLRQSSRKWRLYFNILERKLSKLDMVVTVSRYWAEYLHGIGCNNVRTIYNAFDMQEFNISDQEVRLFRNQQGLGGAKPLVYIGNASSAKGVKNAYHALKDMDYELVMTGPPNNNLQLPVKHFNLARRDYLKLLKAADVVLTMSSMIEGWNRTAHEAMALGTPVIGSGTGGMRELLEDGGQMIASGMHELPEAVEAVLKSKRERGATGRKYVERFDEAYFESAWDSCIYDLLHT